MKLFLITCCLAALVLADDVVPEDDESRIIGGTNAKAGEFPFIVNLQYRDNKDNGLVRFCGGSILNNKYILTAAHCLNQINSNAKDFKVVAGTVDTIGNSEATRQDIKVAKKHIHPGWKNPKVPPYEDDIAILELEQPIKFNANIRSIRLPENGAGVDEPGKCKIAGWGVMKEDKKTKQKVFAQVLQKLEVSLTKLEYCRTLYYPDAGELTDYNICAGGIRGSGCGGDSGGPLVRDINGVPTLIGVASWGHRPCATSPHVYVRVSHYVDSFIMPIIGKQ